MKIKIENRLFYELLQKAYAIVPTKSSLQILSNFKIKFKDNVLEVSATDLEQSIVVSHEAEGEGFCDITVNAKKIFEIIREIQTGSIEISSDENVLIIESENGFTCKIAGTDATVFPVFPVLEKEQRCIVPISLLKTMVLKSSFAVAKEESRACLCGVFFEADSEKISMVATDGHRLGSCVYAYAQPIDSKISAIISTKSLVHLIGIVKETEKEKNIEISLSDKYIIFKTELIMLCSKLIEGTYPDYQKVVPKNNTKKAIINREMLLNAVRRVSVLSNQKTHLVKFSLENNSLEIAVMNKDIGGEAREKLPIEYNGEKLTIGFNSFYFNEILNIIMQNNIRLEMNTQISACLLFPEFEKDKQPVSTDTFLIMPLRIMEEI